MHIIQTMQTIQTIQIIQTMQRMQTMQTIIQTIQFFNTQKIQTIIQTIQVFNTQTIQTIQAIIQTVIQTIQVLNTQTIQSIQFCNSCDVSKYAEGADAISRVGAHPHPSNAVRLESASFFSLLILNPKRGNRLKCEVLLVPNTFRRNFLWRNPRN